MITAESRRVATIILILMATTTAARSADEDHVRTNLAADYAQCWSYYTITSEGVRRGGRSDLAEQYSTLAERAFLRGSQLSNVDVTKARAEMAHTQQLDEMRRDYSNLEILFVKYHQLCNQLMTDPKKRADYWRRDGR